MGKSIKMRVFTAVVLSLCFTASLSQEAEDSERAGRIFYVTTTSSISTIQSISFCYVPTSNLVLVTCSGRRKRANTILSGADGGLDSDISPSAPRSFSSIEDEPESEVETSRGERFVNYWITITFTTTAFTATSSISAVTCTPNGWTYAQCPGTG